jgi:hypothetical protein
MILNKIDLIPYTMKHAFLEPRKSKLNHKEDFYLLPFSEAVQ